MTRAEADREAIYRRLWRVWPEYRTPQDLFLEDPRVLTWRSLTVVVSDLIALRSVGRVEQSEDFSGYRVRMGLS